MRALGKVFLLLSFFFLIWAMQTEQVWRWMYPVYYLEEVRSASEKYKMNPNLVLAIIQTESRFLHGRNSEKGAVGLMQLMLGTAEWIIQKGNFTSHSKERLRDPKVNIELGSWYLRYLLNLYEGNLVLTIAAYNAGPGTVSGWVKTGIWDGQYETINQIPYGETRHYVQRVLYIFDRYEEIYGRSLWKE